MAKSFELNGTTYTSNLDIDVDAIIDKINKAAAGENVPGVFVAHLPKTQTEETEAPGMSLTTMLLLGGLAFVIFKKPKSKE